MYVVFFLNIEAISMTQNSSLADSKGTTLI